MTPVTIGRGLFFRPRLTNRLRVIKSEASQWWLGVRNPQEVILVKLRVLNPEECSVVDSGSRLGVSVDGGTLAQYRKRYQLHNPVFKPHGGGWYPAG